ncbi:MAG: DeoR family transcriptional regulator [Chloroflexi bacterium]|nr:DeoR family transcriptional regulator [Chloroflexota bacterium]
MALPTERQQKILDLLQERGIVSIQEMGGLFGVSDMTVHRDLNQLAAVGQLVKVRGGAISPGVVAPGTAVSQSTPDSESTLADDVCCACHGRINPRTQMVLHLTDGTRRRACCPHCGLISLARLAGQVELALATDFLHGRTVSAHTAVYVVGPAVTICCEPTVLAFLRREEAERFQQGFGGQVLDLAAATLAVQAAMHLGGHSRHRGE